MAKRRGMCGGEINVNGTVKLGRSEDPDGASWDVAGTRDPVFDVYYPAVLGDDSFWRKGVDNRTDCVSCGGNMVIWALWGLV